MNILRKRGTLLTNKDAEREVDATLLALESIRPANAPPFFSMRVRARLVAKKHASLGAHSILPVRVSLAIIAVLVLIGLNVYSVWHSANRSELALKESQRASFAEQYQLTNNQY